MPILVDVNELIVKLTVSYANQESELTVVPFEESVVPSTTKLNFDFE